MSKPNSLGWPLFTLAADDSGGGWSREACPRASSLLTIMLSASVAGDAEDWSSDVIALFATDRVGVDLGGKGGGVGRTDCGDTESIGGRANGVTSLS